MKYKQIFCGGLLERLLNRLIRMYFLFLKVCNIMAGAPAATLDSEATFGMEVNMERPKKPGSVMISQTHTTEL